LRHSVGLVHFTVDSSACRGVAERGDFFTIRKLLSVRNANDVIGRQETRECVESDLDVENIYMADITLRFFATHCFVRKLRVVL